MDKKEQGNRYRLTAKQLAEYAPNAVIEVDPGEISADGRMVTYQGTITVFPLPVVVEFIDEVES